jgi:hypothetical protein
MATAASAIPSVAIVRHFASRAIVVPSISASSGGVCTCVTRFFVAQDDLGFS